MRYTANKSLLLFAAIVGESTAIEFIWAGLPTEKISETLVLLANALGYWLVTSAVTYVMSWIFYKLIVGTGRYIYDRFYRTPTL